MKDRVRELIQADVAGWKRGVDILKGDGEQGIGKTPDGGYIV